MSELCLLIPKIDEDWKRKTNLMRSRNECLIDKVFKKLQIKNQQKNSLDKKAPELGTLEWLISGLMLNPLLISRLNMACSHMNLIFRFINRSD